MDVFAAIKKRRSIRRYLQEDIDGDRIAKLLEAARLAPSAGNRQPWHFFAVTELETRERLAGAAYGQTFVGQAPLIIVICADPERSAERYGDRGRQLYCLQDTAAAVENVLLCATALGLGACWIGAFDEEACATILKVTSGLRPVAMISVGYPDEEPAPRPRRPLQQVVSYL